MVKIAILCSSLPDKIFTLWKLLTFLLTLFSLQKFSLYGHVIWPVSYGPYHIHRHNARPHKPLKKLAWWYIVLILYNVCFEEITINIDMFSKTSRRCAFLILIKWFESPLITIITSHLKITIRYPSSGFPAVTFSNSECLMNKIHSRKKPHFFW